MAMEYGRYRILNPLGQGGMATVYLAEDPLLQRLVAVKVIQAHLSTNSGLIDRFTVEAKTIAGLRNVNIVEVFDFGIQDDQQFLVMEYIDGANLQALCAAMAGKPMPNTAVAAIVCQAAEGLITAEKHGVVHRDIKPENLMFNSEGVLKIADFGIAHIADEQSRTQTGAVLGSPNFMSPEQIEGARPSHKTDLFSLGGVFYYCLTGKMPFTGPSIPVTMRNICERPHPAILEANPGADPFLVQLVDLLLQKAPESRGDGARWLSLQLRSYLNHHGIVDVVDHVRSFIVSLGLGGNQTIVEATPSRSAMRPPRGTSGSSLGGAPQSVIRSGSTMATSATMSKSLAGRSQFQTGEPTTGAMGPSSRSPLVWIGGLLSLCVLVLAGVIIWTRLDHGQENARTVTHNRPISVSRPQTVTPPAQPVQPVVQPAQPTVAAPQPAVTQPVTPVATQAEPRQPVAQVRHERPTPKTHPRPAETRVAATTPREKDPTPPPAEETGFVLIKSAPPFAALTINGKPQGETPMNAFLEVPVGKCHVEIVHRLSPPFDTVINVTPGYRREFKFKLDR
jgi:serine/threonine protein kinase